MVFAKVLLEKKMDNKAHMHLEKYEGIHYEDEIQLMDLLRGAFPISCIDKEFLYF